MNGSPEERLVVVASRQVLSSARRAEVLQLLGGSLDWDSVIRMAWRHGVASLLFKHVTEIGVKIPAAALDGLRRCYVRSAQRNAHHFACLSDVLAEFSKDGVRVLVLKGPHLARSVYTDAALRPFADMDLLVRPADINAAKTALARAGYALSPDLYSERLSRRFHFNLPFVKTGAQPVHIELHWKLNARPGARANWADTLWERSETLDFGAGCAHVLAPEDLVLQLAVHLDSHGYLNGALIGRDDAVSVFLNELSHNRLIWAADIAEVIALHGPSFDWNRIAQRARECGVDGSLATSLCLLDTLFQGLPLEPALRILPQPIVSFPRKLMLGAVRRAIAGKGYCSLAPALLRTRKGFEVRLIRLVDLWDYGWFQTRKKPACHAS